MKIIESAHELPSGCAFVPTMGALHAGHASLIKIAQELSQDVVMSIFVNPMQFERREDFEKYPRTLAADIEIARRSGLSHLWIPSESDVYPGNPRVTAAGPLGDIFEGASRPGHFDGVVTVVRRLFDLAQPAYAIFGEKDFQQLALINQIAGEVKIISAPTIREPSGLALSSRNIRLTPSEQIAALVISRALFAAASEFTLLRMNQVLLETLAAQPSFSIDYAEVIDENDFSLAQEQTRSKRAIIAGWINGVRLIDNMAMGVSEE